MMTVSFAGAIAARCGMDEADVEAVLERHGVVPSPAPPPARSLRLSRLQISGVKVIQGDEQPFNKTWIFNDNGRIDGVWTIASDDNFAGKSSIIQIALWAIRGTPKSVTATVRGWLRHVEADIIAGDRELIVRFDVGVDSVAGAVDIMNGPGEIAQTLPFDKEDAFKQLMSGLMLDALDLEPIATAQTVGRDGKVVPYADRWTAYTGALLFDSDSKALIGEQLGTDLTQRLLQVFLGVPWATTLFQARSRRRVIEADGHQRRKQLAALGGKSLEQLEAELQDVTARIEDRASRSRAEADLLGARRAYDAQAVAVRSLRDALSTAEDELEEAGTLRLRTKRDLLALEEEQLAARFLGRLNPVCCPRCSSRISDDRRLSEAAEGKCSICATTVAPPAPEEIAAELEAAKEQLVDVEKAEKKAKREVEKLGRRLEEARVELKRLGQVLSLLSTRGTAADMQNLELERARLEGALEVARRIIDANQADSEDLAALHAAEEEAADRVEAAAAAILRRASDEVKDLVVRLGMVDVERIDIKRNAHVDILKGGSSSSFGDLSPGERLRVRIATVVALVRSAHAYKSGRHPGLIMIDSPTAEEMADANVEAMLEALAELPKAVDGLQLFVASRGTQRATAVFPSERLIIAKAGEKLW